MGFHCFHCFHYWRDAFPRLSSPKWKCGAAVLAAIWAAPSKVFLAANWAANLPASGEFQRQDRSDGSVRWAGTEKLPKIPAVLEQVAVPVIPAVPAVLDWLVHWIPPIPAVNAR